MKNFSAKQIWLSAAALSVVWHAFGFGAITAKQNWDKSHVKDTVKIRIVEKPPEPKVEPIPPKPAEPPPKPKPKPKEPPKVASERQPPKEPPKEDVKPIQGLDKNSMDPNGKGAVAAPVGNTLMTEDTGERVSDAAALAVDQTADAQLIHTSITIPQYTDAALDANFEGYVIVDVFVDEKGAVKEAELRKKVGYGMDERILLAAQAAKFIARKNKLGTAISGWTELKFNMQIP